MLVCMCVTLLFFKAYEAHAHVDALQTLNLAARIGKVLAKYRPHDMATVNNTYIGSRAIEDQGARSSSEGVGR